MNRFFVDPEQMSEDTAVILGRDVNHIKNALRMKVGEELVVSDGRDRDWVAQIRSLSEDEIELVKERDFEKLSELPARIWLFQGLPKGDKMDLIVQKAVELGACRVIPVAMKRSVVRLERKKGEEKVRRWQAIAESAAKQSGRQQIPEVGPVLSLLDARTISSGFEEKFLAYEGASGMEATRKKIKKCRPGTDIGVFVGPEGGFEPKEVEELEEDGWERVSLGSRILRTETAGFTLLSALMIALDES